MARNDEGRQAAQGGKPTQEGGSNVARVTELSCRSNRSFEEAAEAWPEARPNSGRSRKIRRS